MGHRLHGWVEGLTDGLSMKGRSGGSQSPPQSGSLFPIMPPWNHVQTLLGLILASVNRWPR